jgi:tetratricopeptide (TPR) repeat protein
MKDQLGQAVEAALQADDWVGARKLIRTGLRSKPDDHWLLSRLALTFYEQRQYREALKLDLKALKIAPYSPLVLRPHDHVSCVA